MKEIMLIIFWCSLAIIFYTYVGYGILISILATFKAKGRAHFASVAYLPDITIVIAAYNEGSIIEDKILNTLSLSYPANRRKIILVTDGSTDNTLEIAKKYPEVHHYHQPVRAGKANAVNRIMKDVHSPIVVFSDANTFINPDGLEIMIRHFADQHVGGVAGEKRIIKKNNDNASGSGEGLYWRYESFLKMRDSDVHSVQGAAGEFFSLRTQLYEPPPKNIIIEDFYISMRVIAQGFRFVYEPKAYAIETASASVNEEWKRKVRISAGGLQAVAGLWYMLNPVRYGWVSFQFFSHRVLRWTLAPISLLAIFVSNSILVGVYRLDLYAVWLILQTGWYGISLGGYLLRDKKIKLKGFFVPFYFAMMNLAVYAGFVRLIRGKQSVLWEKAKRA